MSNDATRSEKPYMETDMDTGKSHDLGKQAPLVEREINYTKSPYIVEKKEEYIYASVNKARRRGEDWDGCDRSKSEPPVIGRNNEWQHGIEATEVKTRIETTRSSIHQQELPSRNSSINQGSYQRMSGYSEDGMRGMVGESVGEVQSKNRSDYQETRKPFRYNGNQDRELRNGVYRAEMKVVTPEITDYRGYPYVDVESHESRGDGSRDGSQQPLHGYSNQVGSEVRVTNEVKVTSESIHVQSINTSDVGVQSNSGIAQGTQSPNTLDLVSNGKGKPHGRICSQVTSEGGGSGGDLHVISGSFTNCTHNVDTSCTECTLNHLSELKQHKKLLVDSSESVHNELRNSDKKEQDVAFDKPTDVSGRSSVADTWGRRSRYDPDTFLVSDLTLSLLEGKERVIHNALRRVSSDASDLSDLKASIRHKARRTRTLDDYLVQLNAPPEHFEHDKADAEPHVPRAPSSIVGHTNLHTAHSSSMADSNNLYSSETLAVSVFLFHALLTNIRSIDKHVGNGISIPFFNLAPIVSA